MKQNINNDNNNILDYKYYILMFMLFIICSIFGLYYIGDYFYPNLLNLSYPQNDNYIISDNIKSSYQIYNHLYLMEDFNNLSADEINDIMNFNNTFIESI